MPSGQNIIHEIIRDFFFYIFSFFPTKLLPRFFFPGDPGSSGVTRAAGDSGKSTGAYLAPDCAQHAVRALQSGQWRLELTLVTPKPEVFAAPALVQPKRCDSDTLNPLSYVRTWGEWSSLRGALLNPFKVLSSQWMSMGAAGRHQHPETDCGRGCNSDNWLAPELPWCLSSLCITVPSYRLPLVCFLSIASADVGPKELPDKQLSML